jgi:hypothetical protein
MFNGLRVATSTTRRWSFQPVKDALIVAHAPATQQVQDIAVKAIEGASGARALSHINQIAMEQAKNRPQG